MTQLTTVVDDADITTPFQYFSRYRTLSAEDHPDWMVGLMSGNINSIHVHAHSQSSENSELYFQVDLDGVDYPEALELDSDPMCALGYLYIHSPWQPVIEMLSIANARNLSERATTQIEGLINYLHAVGKLHPNFYILKHT
jgi:hypothetical protein